MNGYGVLTEILPVLALFALGFVLRKASVIDVAGIGILKKLVVNLSLPVLLFDAFFRLEPDGRNLVLALVVFGTCCLMIPAGRAMSTILRLPGPHAPLMFEGYEAGMLGYALFLGIAGDEKLPYFAACDLGQVLFVFTVLRSQLQLLSDGEGGGARPSLPSLGSSLIRSPVIVGIALGLVLGMGARAAGIYGALAESEAASAFWRLVDTLKSLTTPLICLVIGADIRIDRPSLGFALRLSLGRLALMAALAFAIGDLLAVRLLGLPEAYAFAALVLFLLPPPFVIPVFMKAGAEGESRRVATTLSVHSLLSIAAIAAASAALV